MQSKKKALRKIKKSVSRVRCSFRIPETKLRRFHAKTKRRGDDIDELFMKFIDAYNRHVTNTEMVVDI